MTVGEGSVLSVSGNLENEGELINRGEIVVRANWLNSGNYMPATGQVTLAGTDAQRVNHNGQSFARLLVESEADILLESDLEVIAELNLAEGLVQGGPVARIILQEGAEVLGGSQLSYINGVMVQQGTGYKFFPVGTDDYFLPLELLDVQGTNPLLSVRLVEPHPLPRQLQDLESVTDRRYWEVRRLDGFYTGSLVRLGLAGASGYNNLTGLVVAAAEEAGGDYISLGQSELLGVISDGIITSEEPTAFPILTFGKTDEFSLEGEVLIPNAFAPDSPVEDDRRLSIFAVNLQPDQFVFRVFNRWGQVVYETASLDEALNSGWNGINQQTNEPAQFGVYTYYMSGRFSNNQPVEKKGTLTLFR